MESWCGLPAETVGLVLKQVDQPVPEPTPSSRRKKPIKIAHVGLLDDGILLKIDQQGLQLFCKQDEDTFTGEMKWWKSALTDIIMELHDGGLTHWEEAFILFCKRFHQRDHP